MAGHLKNLEELGKEVGYFRCAGCGTHVAVNTDCVKSETVSGRKSITFNKVWNVYVKYREEGSRIFQDARCKGCKRHLGVRLDDRCMQFNGKFLLKRYHLSGNPSIEFISGLGIGDIESMVSEDDVNRGDMDTFTDSGLERDETESDDDGEPSVGNGSKVDDDDSDHSVKNVREKREISSEDVGVEADEAESVGSAEYDSTSDGGSKGKGVA